MTATTTGSPWSWSPDVTRSSSLERMPTLLMNAATTHMGVIEGDDVAIKVAYIDDEVAGIVRENHEIPGVDPELKEAIIATSKFATIGAVSNELGRQPSNAITQIVESLFRSVATAANKAFLTLERDERPISPVGILTDEAGIPRVGTIAADLDVFVRAVADIEGAGGTPSVVLAAPSAWADLGTLHAAPGHGTPLLGGSLANATERSLLGIPVTVSPAVPAGTLVVVDKGSILSARGSIESVTSAVASPHFQRDAVGVRVTFRAGWSVVKPERNAVIYTASHDTGEDTTTVPGATTFPGESTTPSTSKTTRSKPAAKSTSAF